MNKRTALNIVHNPPSMDKLQDVINRLKYEELFAFMFKINYLKRQNKLNNKGLSREIKETDIKKFIKQ